jgi:hypothetical protein
VAKPTDDVEPLTSPAFTVMVGLAVSAMAFTEADSVVAVPALTPENDAV